MKMSSHGQDLLMTWEGFKTSVYKDAAGLATIGVGHLLTKEELNSGQLVISGTAVRYANGLTEQQVRGLLSQDVGRFEDGVSQKVVVDLDQNQFDALVASRFRGWSTGAKTRSSFGWELCSRVA